MKYHFIVLSCLLLVWTLTVFVSCAEDDKKEPEIKVTTVSDGIKVQCTKDYQIRKHESKEAVDIIHLKYQDDNSGEYECAKNETTPEGPVWTIGHRIYVKFRTCENCIELDIAAIMGIVIGDVVATIGVGFGVYLLAAHVRSGPPPTSRNIASDRKRLITSDVAGSSNDHYQQLRHTGRKDEYDVINNKRR